MHFASLIPLIICLCPATVIIGFQQLHCKVNEDEGCASVYAEIVGGQLTPPDSVSFSFTTESNTAVGMLGCCCFVDVLKQPAIKNNGNGRRW